MITAKCVLRNGREAGECAHDAEIGFLGEVIGDLVAPQVGEKPPDIILGGPDEFGESLAIATSGGQCQLGDVGVVALLGLHNRKEYQLMIQLLTEHAAGFPRRSARNGGSLRGIEVFIRLRSFVPPQDEQPRLAYRAPEGWRDMTSCGRLLIRFNS